MVQVCLVVLKLRLKNVIESLPQQTKVYKQNTSYPHPFGVCAGVFAAV